MTETPTIITLERAAANCLGSLRQVHGQLNVDQPGETEFGSVRTSWDRYYFGEFAQFDALLHAYVECGGREYGNFVPLSISHHNLHRLIEVLSIEIRGRPIGETRVEERISDLFEAFNRLEKLQEKTSGAEVAGRDYGLPMTNAFTDPIKIELGG